MGRGARLFFVGGMVSLCDSVDERDLGLLKSVQKYYHLLLFRETSEVRCNNRSVMTSMHSTSKKPCPKRLGTLLQLFIFIEESRVSASHQLVLVTSLPFVHTARRAYRLNGLVNNLDIDLFNFAEHVFRSLLNLIA